MSSRCDWDPRHVVDSARRIGATASQGGCLVTAESMCAHRERRRTTGTMWRTK